jgi:hypothetical protein
MSGTYLHAIYRKTLFYKNKFSNILLLTNTFFSNSFDLFIIQNSIKQIYLRFYYQEVE